MTWMSQAQYWQGILLQFSSASHIIFFFFFLQNSLLNGDNWLQIYCQLLNPNKFRSSYLVMSTKILNSHLWDSLVFCGDLIHTYAIPRKLLIQAILLLWVSYLFLLFFALLNNITKLKFNSAQCNEFKALETQSKNSTYKWEVQNFDSE